MRTWQHPAGPSPTPIHDQLLVEHAVRALSVQVRDGLQRMVTAMGPALKAMARVARKIQEAQEQERAHLAGTLDRIRSDQASLDRWTLLRPTTEQDREHVQRIRAALALMDGPVETPQENGDAGEPKTVGIPQRWPSGSEAAMLRHLVEQAPATQVDAAVERMVPGRAGRPDPMPCLDHPLGCRCR